MLMIFLLYHILENFLIVAFVVSGGNPVDAACVDLSVSSLMSLGVVRFACSSCSTTAPRVAKQKKTVCKWPGGIPPHSSSLVHAPLV